MEITIEKIDDINIIMRGTVDNSAIEAKAKTIQEQEASTPQKEEPREIKPVDEAVDKSNNDTYQQKAESQILKDFIDEGIKKAGINVDDVLGQPGFKKFEKLDNGIYFEIGISTAPEINTDINYADVIPSYTKPKATPADVEAKLKELSTQQAAYTKIEIPRDVVDGDVVVIDFKGFIGGEAFDGGSADGFSLRIGSKSFIPGFEEQLIGIKYGEEKTITVKFPEDYHSKDLAGKETEFKVKLHEIQEQKAMLIDDAFAKKVLQDTDATLDSLKAKLTEQISAQELSKLYNSELKPAVMQKLLPLFEFTLPSNILEQEIDALVNTKMQQMSKEEREFQKNDKKKFHELRDSVRDSAKLSIKSALIVDALARREGIHVSEDEVVSALNYQASVSGQDPEALIKHYKDNNLMTSAKIRFVEDKLFSHILGLYK